MKGVMGQGLGYIVVVLGMEVNIRRLDMPKMVNLHHSLKLVPVS